VSIPADWDPESLEAADLGSGAPDDGLGPNRRVAEAVRALVAELVAAEIPEDLLDETVGRLDELNRMLAAAPRRPPRWAAPAPDGRRGAPSDWLPVGGASNPLAPPVTFRIEEGAVVGEVSYGPAYEGPPGCVHGGMLAAAFDEVLGIAQALSGQFGMTGTLSVRYLRPTPLLVPVRFEGRFERMERRKIFTVGHAEVGGEVTATAEGVFIALDADRFASALERAPHA
jgi:acyl-coenzyme A thioesterase PaaI-like protein